MRLEEREKEQDTGVDEEVQPRFIPVLFLVNCKCHFVRVVVNGNVCTLLGNKPEALFCRPPVAGEKLLCTHGVKSGNTIYWSCGFCFSLSYGRNLVAIGKVFKPKPIH